MIRYDGIEGSAIIDASPGNLNGEVATPFKLQASLENVQEFRVESSTYPAEYGTGSGGQVSVVTKSGANIVHGAVFEYLRNDALDAPNYFDTRGQWQLTCPSRLLEQNQFGGSIGGPIMEDRAFFFGSYEAYRLNAGINIVEAVPSAAAWARAVPAIAALVPVFWRRRGHPSRPVDEPGLRHRTTADAASRSRERLQCACRLQDEQSLVELRPRVPRSRHERAPDSVSGRVIHHRGEPGERRLQPAGPADREDHQRIQVRLQRRTDAGSWARFPSSGVDLSKVILNLSGSVANNGIAGQGSTSGITVPGGLVRANSAQNGHAQPYDPYTLSFIDSLSMVRGAHYVKAGGEFALIRMETDRIGGTTYAFTNLTAFLANRLRRFNSWAT